MTLWAWQTINLRPEYKQHIKCFYLIIFPCLLMVNTKASVSVSGKSENFFHHQFAFQPFFYLCWKWKRKLWLKFYDENNWCNLKVGVFVSRMMKNSFFTSSHLISYSTVKGPHTYTHVNKQKHYMFTYLHN